MELEPKISMFADDTQLFNKDERSVEKSFDILSKYENASGSRINYDKTKAILLALPAIETQNLIQYHGSKKIFKSTI
jgi:hypothetical protein